MKIELLFPIAANNALQQICNQWHGGQSSAMYSVLSSKSIDNIGILHGLVQELRDCAIKCKDKERVQLLGWYDALDMIGDSLADANEP